MIKGHCAMYRGLLPGSELVQLDIMQPTNTHGALDLEDALVHIANVLLPASKCCCICHSCVSLSWQSWGSKLDLRIEGQWSLNLGARTQ